jgi:hypothetical protein
MWINDDIWTLPAFREWHIHFGDDVSDGALLSVTTAEFISDDGFAISANADFADDVAVAISFSVIFIDV